MVHYEGGVEVELRSSFDGVGDRAQKSRGAFARKPLGFIQVIYKNSNRVDGAARLSIEDNKSPIKDKSVFGKFLVHPVTKPVIKIHISL